jgi:hypothetical protein
MLEGEYVDDSEDLKDLSVSDICVTSTQHWYHVTWNERFLDTSNSSVLTDTDLRYKFEDDFRGSLQQRFTFYVIH